MTRKEWASYVNKMEKDNPISKNMLMDMLEDWIKDISVINRKLNLLMDEIFNLNKEINE